MKRRLPPSLGARRGAEPQLRRQEGGSEGYTIAESAVALALLLTVLVPAAGTLTYLVTQQRTQHRIEALAIARHEMERTLAAVRFGLSEGLTEREEAPWRVARTVDRREGLVAVTVEVYRSTREEPLATLRTARLDDRPANGLPAGEGAQP